MVCGPALNHKLKKFCTFPGFLKPFYLRNLTSGRKNYELDNEKASSMDYCGTETLQLAAQFKVADGRIKLKETQLLVEVARHWYISGFPLLNFLY